MRVIDSFTCVRHYTKYYRFSLYCKWVIVCPTWEDTITSIICSLLYYNEGYKVPHLKETV